MNGNNGNGNGNGNGTSNSAAQNTAQFNLASLMQQAPYKNLLRAEQITPQQFPFLSENELNNYPAGVKTLWAAVANKPADDPQHQQALQKLQQLTQNILRKYQVYKAQIQKGPGNAAPQQQQQLPPPPQTQAQQQDAQRMVGQGQSAQQPQIQQLQPNPQIQPQSQMPPQIAQNLAQPQLAAQQRTGVQIPQSSNVLDVQQDVSTAARGLAPDGLPWEPPINLRGAEAEVWKQEISRRYEDSMMTQKNAKDQLLKIEHMMATTKSAGKEVPEEVAKRKTQLENGLANAQKFTEAMLVSLRANRAAAAQAPRNEAAAVQPGGQGQQQHVGNATGQARPQTSVGPPNPVLDAARQQQIGRAASPAIQGQPPQMQMSNQSSLAGPMSATQGITLTRPQLNPAQSASISVPMQQSPQSMVPPGMQASPAPLSQQAAIAASQRSYSNNLPQTLPQSASIGSGSRPDLDKNNRTPWPVNKGWVPTTPQPVSMGPARPTLTGVNNGPMGVMGQPAIQKQPPFLLQGSGDRVLDKKKLDELVRQVTGGSGEGLHPEVEESVLQLADEFIDNVITSACKLAKLRGSSTLEVRDLQLVLERQYNIRVPGYATDEIRTVRKVQPATGYLQKMNAVQAAKVMGGKTDI